MSKKNSYFTSDGISKLEKELEYLKSSRREEVAERIKAAIALGDLSENSEYEDAKNEQAFLEGKIADLENKLRTAEVIDDNGEGRGVQLGSQVVLKNLATGSESEYTLVGSDEADPLSGLMSNESPVGAAILGHMEGDEVEVHVPSGVRRMKIISIRKER
jgi:transcription elongation factor GreA